MTPEIANNNKSMVVDAVSNDKAAVAKANSATDPSSMGRTPNRSTSRPKNGIISAVTTDDRPMAVEISPRPNPSSCATGFKNTPAAKTLIEPCPTIRPSIEAKTIHHRFQE